MNIKNAYQKISYYFKRYGFWATLKKCLKRLFKIKENRMTNQEAYEKWMEKNELNSEELEKQRKYSFQKNPLISIVVPMYHTKELFFKELVESLQNQTYSNWQLCLADGSKEENKDLKKYYENESRIKYKFLNSNKGISENTNEAIKIATGEYIGFLDHDDLLSEDALFEIVKTINKNEDVDFIYSDEDKIDENYQRFEPYFKPDFSPETLECNNYITHFVVVKKDLIEKVGMLDSKFDGAQDFDFVLRATENAKNIIHISKILYHWRVHRNSTANVADAKPYAYEAGLRVVEKHLKRVNKNGTVEFGQDVPGIYKINYEVIGNPKVSILIPNKDNINLLKTCIDSILKLTTYQNYEVVVIENNSEKEETFKYYEKLVQNEKIKVLDYVEDTILDTQGKRKLENDTNKENKSNKKEFNYSSLINYGVKNAKGEYVLQLNNDTKLLTPNWLETFIGYAQNEEIGAVGARLYFEDKSIQHAGIAYGLSGIAGNLLVNLPYGKHAYFGREAATRNVSAVTGACLFARKDIYEKVNYMDEESFKVAFNDVDFCLKILEKGYRIVYNPYVELVHYESKSRGYEISKEKQERFEKECNNFKEKWKERLSKPDPYYNINFTRSSCNFDIETEKIKQ